MPSRRMITWRLAVLITAAASIFLSVMKLEAPYGALETVSVDVGGTPVTHQSLPNSAPAPTVIIAHGFAGSRQLMQPFAVTLAMNGYHAISFDFLGHGRNPHPLVGDITRETGATQALLEETQKIIAYARSLPGGDGRIALLGHSMASDILVRAAIEDPMIETMVAVSMFSSQVTADAPEALLTIVGEYEGFLTQAALDHLALMGVEAPKAEITYSAPIGDAKRRVTISGGTEHVSVLYSQKSLTEALNWLDMAFERSSVGWVEHRAPWLGLLFASVIALGWPLAALLRQIKRQKSPLTSSQFLAISGIAMLSTPMILWPMPTELLPVLVADYLALHFLVYGIIVWTGLRVFAGVSVNRPSGLFIMQCSFATLFVTGAIAIPLDAYVASFVATSADRWFLIGVLAIGTLCFCVSDAWLNHCQGRRWWWPWLSKGSFLVSLAIAISLDLSELFFLIIILPVILLFFAVYGLFGMWLDRASGHPSIGGVALGIAFAWALGVTFPLLAS